MDLLNQSLNQIRDLFASMTPAGRVTSALLVAVIAISLGYLTQGFSGGADELLFNGEFLPPREADRVEGAIATAGLSGYRREGNRFYVPRGQQAAYTAAVANAGALPENFGRIIEESLEISPFMSSEERDQRLKEIRERKISMIVQMMDGVEDAQVLYDIREPKGFGKRLLTATVSLVPDTSDTLDPQRVKMIQKAVAGAIAGLDPKNVTVLNVSDGSSFGGSGGIAAESFDEPYFITRTKYEQFMKQNIEHLLSYVPGIRVVVSAELDQALERQTRSYKNEGDAVAISESTQEQKNLNTRREDRGRPGLTAQGPLRNGVDESVATSENEEETINRDTENFVPTTETVLTESGLVPKRVRVAIAIPSNYLVRVSAQKNPDGDEDAAPPTTELENIEKTLISNIRGVVRPLLPKEQAEDPYEKIEVTVLQSLTPAPIVPPSLASTSLVWAAENFNSLMICGLTLASLLMLRSVVKGVPPAEPSPALGSSTLALDLPTPAPASKSSGGGDEAAKERQRLKLKTGPTLRDDLTEIVREDPDAAAAILRNWIGNAA